MKTIEKDLLARSLNCIDRALSAGEPLLLWHDTTRMHVWTHLSDEWNGKTGLGVYRTRGWTQARSEGDQLPWRRQVRFSAPETVASM